MTTRRSRTTAGVDQRFANWTHGTRSTYVEGCRCDPCTDADSAYSARYKRRRRLAMKHPWLVAPLPERHG